MAELHNALRRTRGLLGAFQKAFGLDQSAGVERLGETLQPTLNIFERPEWALLRGEEWFAVDETQTAGGAGNFSKIGIFNPTGSGLLVVVLDHIIRSSTADSVLLLPTTTLLGNGATVQMLDRRRRVSHGARSHFAADAVAVADRMLTIRSAAAEPMTFRIPIVLPPGQGFVWKSNTDNIQIVAGFVGYQRAMLPSELIP